MEVKTMSIVLIFSRQQLCHGHSTCNLVHHSHKSRQSMSPSSHSGESGNRLLFCTPNERTTLGFKVLLHRQRDITFISRCSIVSILCLYEEVLARGRGRGCLLELETKAIRRFAKMSKSLRRPLLW